MCLCAGVSEIGAPLLAEAVAPAEPILGLESGGAGLTSYKLRSRERLLSRF